MKTICVFCGSSSGNRPVYLAMARRLGYVLAEQGYTIVYGGAAIGLMGAVADAALERDGRVHGVIPEFFAARIAHQSLTELRIVGTMHERKACMFELSDGCIALPGGLGTLEELAEMLAWAQIGQHAKPCGVLDVEGFYDPLLTFLDSAVANGFMKKEHRDMLLVADNPEMLLALMQAYRAPQVDKLKG